MTILSDKQYLSNLLLLSAVSLQNVIMALHKFRFIHVLRSVFSFYGVLPSIYISFFKYIFVFFLIFFAPRFPNIIIQSSVFFETLNLLFILLNIIVFFPIFLKSSSLLPRQVPDILNIILQNQLYVCSWHFFIFEIIKNVEELIMHNSSTFFFLFSVLKFDKLSKYYTPRMKIFNAIIILVAVFSQIYTLRNPRFTYFLYKRKSNVLISIVYKLKKTLSIIS